MKKPMEKFVIIVFFKQKYEGLPEMMSCRVKFAKGNRWHAVHIMEEKFKKEATEAEYKGIYEIQITKVKSVDGLTGLRP